MRSPDPQRTETRRFQFRLSYLLYLLTLCAIGSALLRSILEVGGTWVATSVGFIYVGALGVYFAIRLPILMRRVRRSSRKLALRQQELADCATALQYRDTEPKENP